MGNCEEKFLDVVKHRNSTPKGIFVVFLDAVLLFMFVYLLCVQTKIVLFFRHSWHRLRLSATRRVNSFCFRLAQALGVLSVFVIVPLSSVSVCRAQTRVFSLQVVLTSVT